jgi:hypothetical protein
MQSALTFGLGMLLATALIADEGLAEAPGRQLLTFLPGKPLTICAAENLTNRPIPDVHFSVDGNSRRVDWRRDGQECISIPGLPAGETLIEVSAPGFRSEWVRIERRHDTYDSWTGEPVGIGLFALETGVVQGRVVDAMTGQPIPPRYCPAEGIDLSDCDKRREGRIPNRRNSTGRVRADSRASQLPDERTRTRRAARRRPDLPQYLVDT